MNLRLVTPPAVLPVSVEMMKGFLRVDLADDDALITSLIKAATEKGEELARRAFVTQTWEMIRDDWPYDARLPLYRPPLQSVTSVKYFDSDGVEHTWTDYSVDTRSEPGVIVFDDFPSDELLKSGAVVVRFVAGYGSAATNVPERIKSAIMALVAYWYENRQSTDVPSHIRYAFMGERVVWF